MQKGWRQKARWGELEKRAESIANNLSERIATPILLGDYFQTTVALNDILKTENDVEYVFVTDEEGNIFAHTFNDGSPPEILSWNPLNDRKINVQLLDTEKGYIRDVGVNIFIGTKSELHLGIREDNLKYTLTRMRNITVPLIMFVILIGVIASFFMSRLITKPLNKFVDFTKVLGRGEFGRSIKVQSRASLCYSLLLTR